MACITAQPKVGGAQPCPPAGSIRTWQCEIPSPPRPGQCRNLRSDICRCPRRGGIGACRNAGTTMRRSRRVCARRAGPWTAYSRRGPSVHRAPVAAPDAGMRRSAGAENRIAGQGRYRVPDHLPQTPSPAHSPLRSPARRGLHKCNRNRSAGAGCCRTHPENPPKTGEELHFERPRPIPVPPAACRCGGRPGRSPRSASRAG